MNRAVPFSTELALCEGFYYPVAWMILSEVVIRGFSYGIAETMFW